MFESRFGIAVMEVLGLILARGGSKAIPRKNIRLLAGRPLLVHTIETAGTSDEVDRLVVSTEDEEIREVANEHGAETPFWRPERLATDEACSHGAIVHALDTLQGDGYRPDVFLHLQPTSPFRTSADIRNVVEMLRDGAGAVVSVCEPSHHPYWTKRMDETGRLHPFLQDGEIPSRRQELPEAYAINGAIYGSHVGYYRRHDGFYGPETFGYVMPKRRSVDIDDEFDWQIAEALLAEGVG